MEGQLYNAFLYKELEHLRFPYLWEFWNPSPAPPIDTKRCVYIILGIAERTCAHVFTIISPFPCFLFLLFPVKVSVQSQNLFYMQAKKSDTFWGLGGGLESTPSVSTPSCLGYWRSAGPCRRHSEKRKLIRFLVGINISLYYRSIWLLIKKKGEVAQLCPILCDPMGCYPPGSSLHGDSPGKNIGVGFHFLLHGIFPTQGSNPGLPHCRQTL